MGLIITRTTITKRREVAVYYNEKWFDVDIEMDIPHDEIMLNMFEQYGGLK